MKLLPNLVVRKEPPLINGLQNGSRPLHSPQPRLKLLKPSDAPGLQVRAHDAALPLGLPDLRDFRVTLPDLLIGGADFPANFRRQLIPPVVVYSPQFGF